jgi:hypothetical protein
MKWNLYIVKCKDDTLYCGITSNLEKRIKEHNEGRRGAKYTRSRRPVFFVFFQSNIRQLFIPEISLHISYNFLFLTFRQQFLVN